MHYLYILYSSGSDLYYVGVSTDAFTRLAIHNTTDRDTFTSKHRPWELAGLFECGATLGEARKIENFIKSQKSRRLIELLIQPAFVPTGKLAQLVLPYVRDRTCGINQRVVPQVRDPAGGA
jgi:putative endonuclease